jgi:hypothetical protein
MCFPRNQRQGFEILLQQNMLPYELANIMSQLKDSRLLFKLITLGFTIQIF